MSIIDIWSNVIQIVSAKVAVSILFVSLIFVSTTAIGAVDCGKGIESKSRVTLTGDLDGDQKNDEIRYSSCFDPKTKKRLEGADVILGGHSKHLTLWRKATNSKSCETCFDDRKTIPRGSFLKLELFSDYSLVQEVGEILSDTWSNAIWLISSEGIKNLVSYFTTDFGPSPRSRKDGTVFFYLQDLYFDVRINGEPVDSSKILKDKRCKENQSPQAVYRFSPSEKKFVFESLICMNTFFGTATP